MHSDIGNGAGMAIVSAAHDSGLTASSWVKICELDIRRRHCIRIAVGDARRAAQNQTVSDSQRILWARLTACLRDIGSSTISSCILFEMDYR